MRGSVVYLAEGVTTTEQPFQSWFAPPTCQPAGPTVLDGFWIGVESQKGIGPEWAAPYTIELRLEDLPEYGDLARSHVTVQVLNAATATLTQQDAVDVLQKGGKVNVQLHCEAGTFVADKLLPRRP